MMGRQSISNRSCFSRPTENVALLVSKLESEVHNRWLLWTWEGWELHRGNAGVLLLLLHAWLVKLLRLTRVMSTNNRIPWAMPTQSWQRPWLRNWWLLKLYTLLWNANTQRLSSIDAGDNRTRRAWLLPSHESLWKVYQYQHSIAVTFSAQRMVRHYMSAPRRTCGEDWDSTTAMCRVARNELQIRNGNHGK